MKTLEDYLPWIQKISPLLMEEWDIQCNPDLTAILKNPKLIVVISHSSPLSWIPAIAALSQAICRAGGGQRTPQGVMDRWFYSNPLTKPLAEFISQSAGDSTFESLLTQFRGEKPRDLVLFPEGANSFFGTSKEIKTFRSNRFIELSILSGVPILIVVHRGSEEWGFPIDLPKSLGERLLPVSKFFAERLLKEQSFNLPLPLKKIDKLRLSLKLYQPPFYESDLPQDSVQRRELLAGEAENIRGLMGEMFDSMS